jgi:hypothetical protein
VIPGSDNLMLAAKMPNDGEVHFLETVQMCVAHRLYGDGTFEYPPTTKIVPMGKTPRCVRKALACFVNFAADREWIQPRPV